MLRAGSSFRTRLTAVRMVVLAWSLATGLVRISSAPRRNAVGSPARPSTMAMGTGLVPSWERRQTSKINFAAGRFSQSTNTRSKLWELSFLAADGPSRGRSNVTDISSSTPVMALTAWSSGDKSRAWGIAFNARNPAPDPQVTQVSGEPLTDPPARRGRESERETGPLSPRFSSYGRFRLGIGNRAPKGRLVRGREVGEGKLPLVTPLLNLLLGGRRPLFVEPRITGQVNGARWKGKVGAGLLYDLHDAQQEVLADGGKFREVLREHIAEDFQRQGIVVETGKADARTVGFYFRMFVQHAPHFGQEIAQLIWRSLISYAERGIEPDFVAAGKVLDIHGCQRAIGDGKLGPVQCTNSCGPQADVLDSTDAVSEAAEVSNANDFIGQHRNAAKEVLESLLCRECNRKTADSEACKNRGEVKSECAQDREHCGRNDCDLQQTLAEHH